MAPYILYILYIFTVCTVYNVLYVNMSKIMFTELGCYAPMSEHLHLARKRTVFLYVIASIVCTVLYCIYCIYCIFTWYGLKQDDQLTVCQPFVNLQRTEHSRRDLQDERNARVHNNASNGNRQRNRRIY